MPWSMDYKMYHKYGLNHAFSHLRLYENILTSEGIKYYYFFNHIPAVVQLRGHVGTYFGNFLQIRELQNIKPALYFPLLEICKKN